MTAFAQNPAFVAAHLNPTPYQHFSVVGGKMIRLKTKDTLDAQAYFIPAKKASPYWLFVYQEWWGLNDYIKKQADVFYASLNESVNILALDMYDGKVATTSEEASSYMKNTNKERLEMIMKAGIAYAPKSAKIASVGWCFGGGLSLKSALLEGKQAVGCIMYYGMPILDAEQLKTLHTDVLGHFATEEWISKKVVEDFEAQMKKVNKTLTYKIFEAPHAFANPSNPKYNAVYAEEAYTSSINYLKKKFGLQ